MYNLDSIYEKAFRELLKLVDSCAKFDIDETNLLGHARIEKLCQDNFNMSYRELLKKVYCNEKIIDINKMKLKKIVGK